MLSGNIANNDKVNRTTGQTENLAEPYGSGKSMNKARFMDGISILEIKYGLRYDAADLKMIYRYISDRGIPAPRFYSICDQIMNDEYRFLVQKAIDESGVKDGLCCVYVPHTTAGVFINEGADPSVMDDLESTLDRIVPWNGPYSHSEGNAAAHVKATMVGESVTVIVEGGRLKLGTWQAVFFAEFDGPRRRTVWIKIIPVT